MGDPPHEWVLAHQGGWDELLMFGIPIVLAIVGVRWAERRARARQPEDDGLGPHGDDPDYGEPSTAIEEGIGDADN